jgi:hypothetical protein
MGRDDYHGDALVFYKKNGEYAPLHTAPSEDNPCKSCVIQNGFNGTIGEFRKALRRATCNRMDECARKTGGTKKSYTIYGKARAA